MKLWSDEQDECFLTSRCDEQDEGGFFFFNCFQLYRIAQLELELLSLSLLSLGAYMPGINCGHTKRECRRHNRH